MRGRGKTERGGPRSSTSRRILYLTALLELVSYCWVGLGWSPIKAPHYRMVWGTQSPMWSRLCGVVQISAMSEQRATGGGRLSPLLTRTPNVNGVPLKPRLLLAASWVVNRSELHYRVQCTARRQWHSLPPIKQSPSP